MIFKIYIYYKTLGSIPPSWLKIQVKIHSIPHLLQRYYYVCYFLINIYSESISYNNNKQYNLRF